MFKKSCIFIVLLISTDVFMGKILGLFGNPSTAFYLSTPSLLYKKHFESKNISSIKQIVDFYSYWKNESEEAYLWIEKGAKLGNANYQYLFGSKLISDGDIMQGKLLIVNSANNGEPQACDYIHRRADLKISIPKKCLTSD